MHCLHQAEEEDDEKLCRFCFDGENDEDGELVAPCDCKSGQKWVHLKCLRRWQRMVLVSQPTHPAFWQDDKRHHKCNICTARYKCKPPTRSELMESFTGAEIAALISAGCVIGSGRVFSLQLEEQVSAPYYCVSSEVFFVVFKCRSGTTP